MSEASKSVILTYRGVSKSFGYTAAVRDIDLDIRKGEIFGFIGPDGAGKTTLIRIAMGIVSPDCGECIMLGMKNRRTARIHAGYVPQLFSLYTDMSVLENIALFGSLYGTPKESAMRRGESVLRRTGLWPFRDRLVGKLSGGMRQKLALATGLLHTPEILFLDEPTTGVDPAARREFWSMLYDLNMNGLTIILSTPYMDEAELCTRKMFISNGTILDIGTTDELLERYDKKILKLETGDRRAKSWIMECPGVYDANLFGSAYHIVTGDITLTRQAVREYSRSRGIFLPEAEEITPSLEDLFVNFVGEVSQH